MLIVLGFYFNFYTGLPIICNVLKNQACNIYKYWSYNWNLRVLGTHDIHSQSQPSLYRDRTKTSKYFGFEGYTLRVSPK